MGSVWKGDSKMETYLCTALVLTYLEAFLGGDMQTKVVSYDH